MQGRCTLGNAHLAFTSHDIKLDDECVTIHEVTACGDVDNIIISDDQCHIISGPESVVLRLDYLHINTSLSADIEITAPSNRQCHTQDGNLVIRVNTNAPRQQEATEEQRVMNLHEEFVVGPTNNSNNNNNTHNFIESLITDIGPFQDKQCVICQNSYAEQQWHTFLPCAHGYHSMCIREWIKRSNKCPECNRCIYNDQA